MSTIYIGMHDRRARFPHERQKDDAPYVPLHELNAALEANRSLVRQMAASGSGNPDAIVVIAFLLGGIAFPAVAGIVWGVLL